MVYVWPNQKDSKVEFRSRYQNFIGGEWVRPVREQYFENITPVTGRPFCEVPRSTAEDIEKAIDAACSAKIAWCKSSPAWRAQILGKIADRLEQNVERLAVAETWDTGKPIRETLAADLPLCIDQFRYFAACLRAQEGTLSDIDYGTVGYNYCEPFGVVGQIVPWTFPLLSAIWKLGPALAAGNCTILKPAEQTPASVLVLMDLIHDLLPAGVVNVVNGYSSECVKPIVANKRIQKVAFTGDVPTGRLIAQYACENLVPVNLELCGKSYNLVFEDLYAKNDELIEKAVDCFAMFALSQGDMCCCPSRTLVDAKVLPRFMERAIERTKKCVPGNPLDVATTVGAQISGEILDKTLGYIELGKKEGAKLLLGGERVRLGGDLAGGFYMTPAVFQTTNKMRVFNEEMFGPVVGVTAFNTYEEAMHMANETSYGVCAGVWTRDTNLGFRAGRALQVGRVLTNTCYLYPSQAAFAGYRTTTLGRDAHCTTLDQYQMNKNVLVSYEPKPLGFY